MAEIVFSMGNEKRFFDFISSLNEKDKTALLSHTDLDGIVSAKVVNKVVNADILEFVSYGELNSELISELRKKRTKKIIITDLNVKKEFLKELEKFSDVLLIDHHVIMEDFNSDHTIYLNAQGYCAAYICYYLFSKIQNIEKLDWLVACASISDCCYEKNRIWLSGVYEKYGEKFYDDELRIKKGKFWELQYKLNLAIIYFDKESKKIYNLIGETFSEIGQLEKCSREVQKEVDEFILRFEKEKIKIKNGFFFEFKPHFSIASLVSTQISVMNKGVTYVMGRITNKGIYSVSARRSDGLEDMNFLVRQLTRGFKNCTAGGHREAAGAFFPLKYREEFRRRLLKRK